MCLRHPLAQAQFGGLVQLSVGHLFVHLLQSLVAMGRVSSEVKKIKERSECSHKTSTGCATREWKVNDKPEQKLGDLLMFLASDFIKSAQAFHEDADIVIRR